MSIKSDFVTALQNDGEIVDLKELVCSLAPNTGGITDTESAVMRIAEIEQAMYNGIVCLFDGVHLFDFLLRGMQRTPQLSALTMVQLRAMAGAYALDVQSPVTGVSYVGCLPCIVSAESAARVMAIGTFGAVPLERMGDLFVYTFPVSPGTYDVRFVAIDATGKQQAEIVSGVIITDFEVTPAPDSEPETVSEVTVSYDGDPPWRLMSLTIDWDEEPVLITEAVISAGMLTFDVSAAGLLGVCHASISLKSKVLAAATKTWDFIVGGE